MPPTKNRVWLQGEVASQPTLRSLPSDTSIATFQLGVVETWRDERGHQKERKNLVPVEVLGTRAEQLMREIRYGSWVTIEGYLRVDQIKGQSTLRVRTYSIEVWSDDPQRPVEGRTGMG